MGVEITATGPFFAVVQRGHEVDTYLNDARDEVAKQAFADVHQNLNASIKRPTPYYETQISVQTRGAVAVVHDCGVIYGPWLEGVGSRNRKTRFKGYFSFRRAAGHVRGRAGELAQHAVDALVRRLGGL